MDRDFSRRLFPRFWYHAGEVRLTKTVVGIHGENPTLLDYRVSGPMKTTILELRPFVSGRDFHSLRHAGEVPPMSFHEASALFRSGPWEREQVLWISIPDACFEAAPDWHHNVEYLRKLDRGLDFREDLWTPGIFSLDVSDGHRVRIVVSARKPERRADALLGDEIRRRRDLLRNLPTRDRIIFPLTLAADQFIVRRGAGCSFIAGYHCCAATSRTSSPWPPPRRRPSEREAHDHASGG